MYSLVHPLVRAPETRLTKDPLRMAYAPYILDTSARQSPREPLVHQVFYVTQLTYRT